MNVFTAPCATTKIITPHNCEYKLTLEDGRVIAVCAGCGAVLESYEIERILNR